MVSRGGEPGGEAGERLLTLGFGGVDHDLASLHQSVEDLPRALTSPHQQAQGRVLGVAEPVQGLQLDASFGTTPAGGVVQDPAAADGGQLVPVAGEPDPGSRLIRDGEQGQGGVLIEHPGLVDQEQVPGTQTSLGRRLRRDPAPVTILVPPIAVLVDEPGRRECLTAHLLLGDAGRLEGWGDHHQPVAPSLEHSPGSGQRGRLSGAGGTLHHQQRRRPHQQSHGHLLRAVELLSGDHLAHWPHRRPSLRACCQPADQVVLDLQHRMRGQGAHMLRGICSG